MARVKESCSCLLFKSRGYLKGTFRIRGKGGASGVHGDICHDISYEQNNKHKTVCITVLGMPMTKCRRVECCPDSPSEVAITKPAFFFFFFFFPQENLCFWFSVAATHAASPRCHFFWERCPKKFHLLQNTVPLKMITESVFRMRE